MFRRIILRVVYNTRAVELQATYILNSKIPSKILTNTNITCFTNKCFLKNWIHIHVHLFWCVVYFYETCIFVIRWLKKINFFFFDLPQNLTNSTIKIYCTCIVIKTIDIIRIYSYNINDGILMCGHNKSYHSTDRINYGFKFEIGVW